jgi:hypothetical protein
MHRPDLGTPFAKRNGMATAGARICVGSTEPPPVVALVQRCMPSMVCVRSLSALFRHLDELARTTPQTESTLDLIGAADAQGLLHLGGSVIDGANVSVLELFSQMADERLLQRLRVNEVRLLGCRTAAEMQGQDTIRRLAQILRVRVLGTTELIYRDNFRGDGFDPVCDDALVDEGAMPTGRPVPELPLDGARATAFKIDALSLVRAKDLQPVPWPRFVVPRTFDPRSLASMVRSGEGCELPGLLALPRCELMLPARRNERGEEQFHAIDVLFNWTMLRIHNIEHPNGAVYPVVSPSKFVKIFIALPQLMR